MKSSRHIYTIALMLLVTATLGLSAVRVLALLIEFDGSALYYAHDAGMPGVFSVGAAVAVFIALLFVILLRSDLSSVNADSSPGVVVMLAALLGFVIFGSTIFSLFGGFEGVDALDAAIMIFSIPAALYYIAAVAMPVGSPKVRISLAICLVLWMFLKMIDAYFSGGVEINNPNKALMLTAMAVSLIFIVAECRFQVGSPRRTVYVFSGFASLVVLGLYTLPNMILILLRVYPDKFNIMTELTLLALFFYILVRVCVISGMIGDDYYDDEYEDEDDGYKGGEWDEYDDDEDNAPAPSRPAVRQAPAQANPAVRQAPAQANPAVRQAPAQTNPAVRQAPAQANPAVRQAPAQANPAVRQAPAQANPAVRRAPAQTNPAVRQAPAQANPAVRQAPAQANPAARRAPTQANPAVRQAPAPQSAPAADRRNPPAPKSDR